MKPGDVIPSNSVIIPADVAKEIATHFRKVNAGPNSRNEKWADLLDPQPPSLREQVAKAWCAEVYGEFSGSAQNPAPDHLDAADAVLAVVADWLAAQPTPYPNVVNCRQRDHDVRLLRVRHDPSATTEGGAS